MGCAGSTQASDAGSTSGPNVPVAQSVYTSIEDKTPQLYTTVTDALEEISIKEPSKKTWKQTPLEQMKALDGRSKDTGKAGFTFDHCSAAISKGCDEDRMKALNLAFADSRTKAESLQASNFLNVGLHLREGARVGLDEAAALVLYTAMCENDDHSYYRHLNTLLRNEHIEIEAYIPMLRLNTLALQKLKPHGMCMTYRAITGDVSSMYQIGGEHTWFQFTSTSTTISVVEKFMDKSKPRTIFFISCVSGYDIKSFSLFPAQDEILLPSGLKLLVTGKCEAGGGLTIITLQESADSPDSALNYTLPELPKPMQLPAPKPILTLLISRWVGRKPEDRTWRDEWRAAYTADRLHQNKPPPDAEMFATGSASIEAKLKDKQPSIAYKVETLGWPQDLAEGFQLLTSYVVVPLSEAMLEGRKSGVPCTQFAASTHFICEAVSTIAKGLSVPAPLCYRNLTGKFGLADDFEEWRLLLDDGRAVPGHSFLTASIGTAYSKAEHLTTADGIFTIWANGGWMPQTDSPVVSFVSKGQDADGLHTLIADNEFGAYRLPPMATITIDAVYPPGEGEAYGVKVKSKLFVVSLSYRTGSMPTRL